MDPKTRFEKIIPVLEDLYPNIEVSLDFKNVYELLVATMLSAQTTDVKVNEVTPQLFEKYPDILSLSKANKEDIVPLIKTIGLYNTKSKSLVGMAKKVVEDYDGEIPNTMNGLTSLPGVGRKTANVVMGNGFGIEDSGITVDTHVKRLSKRIGLTEETTARKVEKDLMKTVPQEYWVDVTHYLISHGRAICKARSPKCQICEISSFCKNAFSEEFEK